MRPRVCPRWSGSNCRWLRQRRLRLLYKWKDDQGRWNVTDQPPAGRPYEAVRVDPDTNVLPAGVPPEQDND